MRHFIVIDHQGWLDYILHFTYVTYCVLHFATYFLPYSTWYMVKCTYHIQVDPGEPGGGSFQV